VKRFAAITLMLSSLAAWSADGPKPETPMLKAERYRTPLEQVIVTVPAPYWQREGAPRWDKPKVEVQTESAPPRLQWAPRYARDEADEYKETRDTQNPKPRAKLFEIKF
jgi:hypothetical protein